MGLGFPVVLMSISPTTHDIKRLFICLLTICIASYKKCLPKCFAHFLNWSFVCDCWIVRTPYIFREQISYQIHVSEITFSPSLGCVSFSLMAVFATQMILPLMTSGLPTLFSFLASGVVSKKFCLTQDHEESVLYFLLEVLSFYFITFYFTYLFCK